MPLPEPAVLSLYLGRLSENARQKVSICKGERERNRESACARACEMSLIEMSLLNLSLGSR